jgi:hypothetical protein
MFLGVKTSLRGLKPLVFCAFFGTAEQLAEREPDFDEIGEKQTSGPKGRADSAALMPGINPRPTSRQSFSASSEAVP